MTINIERGSLPLILEGKFKPWSIDAGHGKVLLRGFLADFESEDPPRVFDVLFQDVSRISIADRYSGLRITVAGEGEKRIEQRRVGGEWRDSKMFLLGDGTGYDYIVAGFIFLGRGDSASECSQSSDGGKFRFHVTLRGKSSWCSFVVFQDCESLSVIQTDQMRTGNGSCLVRIVSPRRTR
jgi:hypothetical protein